MGSVIGGSEKQTQGILAAALGKVLVIDEAYGLYGGSGSGLVSDPFRTAVIDAIVAGVQSVPGDDRCVLLLGYRNQMEEMFQNVNPGLSRRFPIASAFVFEDFNDARIRQILDLKIKSQDYTATGQAKDVAISMLDRARNRPNFGNAGEIDVLLDVAKTRHQSRFSRGEAKSADLLEALDFDEHFDRADRSGTNVRKLFEGTVGSDKIIQTLEQYQETVRFTRSANLDPKEAIHFNFLFRGPPGTGKTTTARKMGKVFYDMGFLADATVVECSASDLIGQYVGQTGPKVRQLLDKALGRVLFIDQAYRLAAGAFAQEAIDEITDSTTKPRYEKKLIIILAGYEQDINRLMSTNPGLTSRFPEVMDFHNLTPAECVTLLRHKLKKQAMALRTKNASVLLSFPSLEEPTEDFQKKMEEVFDVLSKQANWASARDVGTLAQKMFNSAMRTCDKGDRTKILISQEIIESELQVIDRERRSRGAHASSLSQLPCFLPAPSLSLHADQRTSATRTADEISTPVEDSPPSDLPRTDSIKVAALDCTTRRDVQRDSGVSDEIWEELQNAKLAEKKRNEEFHQLQRAKDSATVEAREKIMRRLLDEERRREEEQQRRARLETMDVCPMGHRWTRVSGGYRCEGGSHFVGESQLGFGS